MEQRASADSRGPVLCIHDGEADCVYVWQSFGHTEGDRSEFLGVQSIGNCSNSQVLMKQGCEPG